MEPPAPGTLFDGRYRLERLLGEGGFAKVFLASDERATRSIALKILTPDAGAAYDPVTKARFQREVQLVARLRSPYSVRLFDYGESEHGLLYMVLELVPGSDLSDILKQSGPLHEGVVAHILRQVLEALREAHSQRLLHRDIKPENIRVFEYMDDPWFVKLLDFGIAKDTAPDTPGGVTQGGALVGTPRYMSPEQLLSEPLTPASDIYSLGVTAYEMLMGSAAMHGLRVGDQLERLAQTGALHLPNSQASLLREVVHRMVARDPRSRFQAAEEVIEALDRAMGRVPAAPSAPQPAPPPSTPSAPLAPPRPAPPPDSRKLVMLGIVLLCSIGIAAAVLLWIAARGESDPALAATEVAQRRRLVLPMAEPEPSPARTPTRTLDVGSASDAQTVAIPPGPPGCGRPAPHFKRQKMRDERGRKTTVYVPTNYDENKPHPVVLMFHDELETDSSLWWDSGFEQLSEKHGVIVALPRDAMFGNWSDPVDINAGADAVNMLQEELCIDFDRIYAVGNGAGAPLVQKIACAMPKIKAFATMSYRSEHDIVCPEKAPIPYIHFTATQDGHLPPDGGTGCRGVVPSLAEHEARWRGRNFCGSTPAPYSKWRKNVCTTWECDVPFVSCVMDAGRGWPLRTKPRQYDFQGCDGVSESKYDMAETIWSFFVESTAPNPP